MSDNASVFLKPLEYYQRNVDPVTQYIQQNAYYLSKMTGDSTRDCRSFIIESVKAGEFEGVKDPTVTFFERGDNYDREVVELSLSQYLKEVKKNSEILAPTFTSYVNEAHEVSILSEFTDANAKTRGVAKKLSQKAKAAGDMATYINEDNRQDNMKRTNNSVSGAFNSNGNVLQNPTAHSTLTSITRTLASLSNASNEKIISGNRHYRSPDITLFNIVSICANLDRQEFTEILNKYKLYIPTVYDCMSVITYSTNLYWRSHTAMQPIVQMIKSLDDVERAAFVYIGDLYHIRKYNENFVRNFIKQLSRKVTDKKVENARQVLSKIDEQVVNYAHQVCLETMRGKGKNYSLLNDAQADCVAATALNICDTVDEYRDFINAIFLTDSLPPSTAFIPSMIRRCVVLSDTDSTMFSIDEWVLWYFGKLDFSEEGFAVAGSIMFIATQCIAHILGIFSANMGVARDKIFRAAMKPEFCFPVFGQTPVAKHYYTIQLIKEGNVWPEAENEIKGVHLKSSASPKETIKSAHQHMRYICDTVMQGKGIKLTSSLVRLATIERDIQKSLVSGKVNYYKSTTIKPDTAYQLGPEESPYQHYIFWNEVFAPKYGPCEDPTYLAIKIPTKLNNKTKIAQWIDSIEDEDFAQRMLGWIRRKSKDSLNTIYISKSYAFSKGIPPEVVSVIDYKKIILDLTITERLVLESLGYYPKQDWLLSECGY